MGGIEGMSRCLIAGIGCRRNCAIDEIMSILDRACATLDRARAASDSRLDVLAAPAFKSHEPALRAAALRIGAPLVLIDAAALAAAQERCTSQSLRAEQAVGFASVAEACALAAAGPRGRLLLPRIASFTATCALAEGPAA
jgi:cobalt-precorrin 5A hydrolase